jgi:hypothetical protein
MPENISISGQVKGYDGKPINMIRVTMYRESDPASEVQREYTDEQGNYQITVPAGGPMTLRFDTHYSLTNSRSDLESASSQGWSRRSLSGDD